MLIQMGGYRATILVVFADLGAMFSAKIFALEECIKNYLGEFGRELWPRNWYEINAQMWSVALEHGDPSSAWLSVRK